VHIRFRQNLILYMFLSFWALLWDPPGGAWEANVRITEAPRLFLKEMCVSPQ
jgi:hypothetical protein